MSVRILEQVAEAERTAAGEYNAPRGDLAVTAPAVFGRLQLLPAETDFLARYAEMNIRLMLYDRNVHLMRNLLIWRSGLARFPTAASPQQTSRRFAM